VPKIRLRIRPFRFCRAVSRWFFWLMAFGSPS
jgi:hypothetical protein